MSGRAYWSENFKHSIGRHERREVVFTLVAAFIVALGYGTYVQDAAFVRVAGGVAILYFLVQLALVSPWRMWNDAQARIAEYEDRLRPRISFVLHQEIPPYVHHFKAPGRDLISRTVRICRVGLRNDSSAIIADVRVVIESMVYLAGGTPRLLTTRHPVDIEHALNVMGIGTKTGHVHLSPGDLPTAYVDVVEHTSPDSGKGDQWMSPCYASGDRTQLTPFGTWALRLRVEGGGTYSRKNFVIRGSETEGVVLDACEGDPFADMTEKAEVKKEP